MKSNDIALDAQLLQSRLALAKDMAQQAGNTLKHYFRTDHLQMTTKSSVYDIVTAADKAAEQLITTLIHQHYPTDAILSEESGDDHHSSSWQWVIDPLDGTVNFSAGLRQFCVSIGLKHNGTTVLGCVYAPCLDECYWAILGQGAYCNEVLLQPHRRATSLSEAIVSTGFPYDKATTTDNNLDSFARVMPRVRGIRRLGAAALDICLVAAGWLDGYWELGLHEWDVCAAQLIATEARAVVKRYRPDRAIALMAASPAIATELQTLISEHTI